MSTLTRLRPKPHKPRITLVKDLQNPYQDKLYIDEILIATGNSGLEALELTRKGKQTLFQITISSNLANMVVLGENCPETHRYERVIKARVGDAHALGQVQLNCEMLKISPNACDGCPKYPLHK